MKLLGIYDFSDALKRIKQDPVHLAMKLSYWDECYIKIVMPSDNEYEAYFALYTAEGSVPFILQYSDILCGTWELLKLDTMGEDTPESAPEEEGGEEDYGNSEESELESDDTPNPDPEEDYGNLEESETESDDTPDSAPEEKEKDFRNLNESELDDELEKFLTKYVDAALSNLVPKEKGKDFSNPEESKTDDEPEEIPGFGLAFDVAVKMLSHLRDDGFAAVGLRRKGWKYLERHITLNMTDTESEDIYTEIGVPYCASITDIVSTDWYLISL